MEPPLILLNIYDMPFIYTWIQHGVQIGIACTKIEPTFPSSETCTGERFRWQGSF